MIIDKTFSKSELINIIKTYKIDIDNPGKYRKVELSALLVQKLNSLDEIIPSPNLPFLNIIELKFYLTNVNPKKTLSIKEKNEVVMACKRIKHFCDNNYNLDLSVYRDEKHLQEEISRVRAFGSVPSVRLAIKKYNRRPELEHLIDVNIPEYIQRELVYRDKLRDATSQHQLHIKKGKFILTF